MSTRIENIPTEKVASKVFSCSVHEMDKGTKKLNELLDAEGWVVEKTEVVNDHFVVLLKQEVEARKVFYIDVGGMPPDEVANYVDEVRKRLREADDDLYIPVRE